MVLLNTGEIYAQNTQGEEALLPDNMTAKTCSTVMESNSTVAVVNASAEANKTLDSAAGPSVSRADVEDAAVRVNTFIDKEQTPPPHS
jgi:hypothetical protein